MLFPISTPLSYAVVGPLAARLAGDGRYEVVISSRHVGARESIRILGPGVRRVHRLTAPFRFFDAVVCPGFYFRPRRATHLIQMFHGVSPKNYAARDDVKRFESLFVIGEYHRNKMIRAGCFDDFDDLDTRVGRIGMPKLDRLVCPDAEFHAEVTSVRGSAERPCVLYAPTRSGAAGSSLESFGLEVVERLARMPVDLIVKLHDRSETRFRRKLTVDYRAEIRRRAPQARLAEGHDVVPLLAAADVLVSDLSSVAGEYTLLDRPIVLLACPEHEAKIRQSGRSKFGPDDEQDLDWMQAMGERVEDAASAAAAVERALGDPGARSELRRERATALFYNPGGATTAAALSLESILGMETR